MSSRTKTSFSEYSDFATMSSSIFVSAWNSRRSPAPSAAACNSHPPFFSLHQPVSATCVWALRHRREGVGLAKGSLAQATRGRKVAPSALTRT